MQFTFQRPMDKLTREIVEFTRELVRTPSQNHIDSEAAVAGLVFERLKSFGFQPEMIGSDEHPSIVCRAGNPSGRKTIWLESSLDTVPAGDESKWTHPPFGAAVEEGKMYGRGTADAKVAIAIFSILARELSQDADFDGSLFLGFDADEQTGNFTGIREVLTRAPDADVCILGYQGMKEISIGARGWLRLRLTIHGRAAHTGSRSKKGENAIHVMAEVIDRMKSSDLGGATEPFFEFGSSFNTSLIRGGEAINIVPDRCEADMDIRLLPSQTKDDVLERIRTIIDQSDCRYDLDVLQYERAFRTDPDDAFVGILRKHASEALGGDISLVASGQGSVGNVVSQKGIPIINAFGVESGNVHAVDEWIGIDSIPTIFGIYRESIKEFCQ